MWRSRKVKAFTLVEVVVTLLVSTIVFGACYLLLQLMQRSSERITNSGKDTLEINQLEHALAHDFQNSSFMLLSEQGITCIADSSSITYTFAENVTRQTTSSSNEDTFHVDVLGYTARMMGGEVTQAGKKIESLALSVYKEPDTFRLYLYRPYSAEERIHFKQ